jgi:hypothetical protein
VVVSEKVKINKPREHTSLERKTKLQIRLARGGEKREKLLVREKHRDDYHYT